MMQDLSFREIHEAHAAPEPMSEDLSRILNTAIVSTRATKSRDFAGELYQLMETPAFRAIAGLIRQHAAAHGLTEAAAAEQIIRTFRKLDELWSGYIFQEGVDRVGSSGT